MDSRPTGPRSEESQRNANVLTKHAQVRAAWLPGKAPSLHILLANLVYSPWEETSKVLSSWGIWIVCFAGKKQLQQNLEFDCRF